MSVLRHIIIAAGGTGGHMVPAEGVGDILRARGHKVTLITDQRGDAYRDIMTNYDRHVLATTGLSGGLIGKIKGLVTIIRSFECLKLYKASKPDIVIGFGGYPSLPAVLAARLKSVPYMLHEQNTVLGRVNRLMAKGCHTLALAYENTSLVPAGVKTALTGNPVRSAILKFADTPYNDTVKAAKMNILIMGGSQGARILSEIFPRAIADLPAEMRNHIKVSHQARPEDIDSVKDIYNGAEVSADVRSYFTDVPERMAKAHIVCSRAGASSLAEISVLGRPSILVPLAIAMDDHQTSNAKILEDVGAAWSFDETKIDGVEIRTLISKLYLDSSQLEAAAKAAKNMGVPQAAENLADLIENCMSKGEKS